MLSHILIATLIGLAVTPPASAPADPTVKSSHNEQGGRGDGEHACYVGPANFVLKWSIRGSEWECEGTELRYFDAHPASCFIGISGRTNTLHTVAHGLPNITHGPLTAAVIVRAVSATDEPVVIDFAAFEDESGIAWSAEVLDSWPIGGEWSVVFVTTGDDFPDTARIDSPMFGLTLGFSGSPNSTVAIDYSQIHVQER